MLRLNEMNQRKAGVILSYINMGTNAFIGFIYIPLLLAFLTKEQYGLYQLVGSMIAYIAVMDFGLANTTVRYYSRLRSLHDVRSQENLLAVMLRLYTGIAAAIIVVGFLLLQILLPFYGKTLSAEDLITARQVYWILLFNLAVVVPGHVFSAIIQSHEKFIFLRSIGLLNIILQPLLVYIILHFRASIVALAVVQTLCNIGVFAANFYYSVFKLKARFRLHKWDGKFVREILFFSFFIFVNAMVDQIYWKSGQLILGAVVGTVAVAIYSVTVQLCMAFMSFSANISAVFLPRLSALAAQNNMDETNAIFLKVGRLQFYIVMLIFWGFVLFGRQFLHLWVGDSFLPAYTYTVILMAGLIIPVVQNTGILILQAKNKHSFRALVFTVFGLLNVCISIQLAKHFGAMACACVTAGCLLMEQGLILNVYYAKLGVRVLCFFGHIFKIFLATLLPVGTAAWLLLRLPAHPSVFELLFQIACFSLLYALTMWTLAMNDYEKNLILAPLKKVLQRT